MLVTPLFWLLIDEQDNFHELWNFWEISPKKIEKNQRQSQIIAGEHLPSWSLSLVTKIIFFLFTTSNYIPNLAPHLSMAFNELEKQKC